MATWAWRRHERLFVGALMLLAMARVALYAALLPAASRPDESQHYDRVLATSFGDLSLGLKRMSAAGYASTLWGLRERGAPPPRESPGAPATAPGNASSLRFDLNHEYCEPPLYYYVMGPWHWIGVEIFWRPSLLPYWDRLLNCLVVGGLVGLGYLVSRDVFSTPQSLIAPAFLALLPQSDFYGINNDAFMPIAFGLFTLAYAKFATKEGPGTALLCGIALAACVWIKTVSVPVVLVGCVAVVALAVQRTHTIRNVAALGLGLTTIVPLLVLNQNAFGHLTGAWIKMELVGHSIRPLSGWFSHPVFSPTGCVAFLAELSNYYWLGEMPLNHWHGESLFNVPYSLVWLCPALTVAVVVGAACGRASLRPAMFLLCEASFLGSVLFLATASAATDFGIRPASAWWSFPGFVGGRLMIGTLLPFSILVAAALGRVQARWLRVGILVAAALVLNAMSVWMLADCFTDRYCSLFTEL